MAPGGTMHPARTAMSLRAEGDQLLSSRVGPKGPRRDDEAAPRKPGTLIGGGVVRRTTMSIEAAVVLLERRVHRERRCDNHARQRIGQPEVHADDVAVGRGEQR